MLFCSALAYMAQMYLRVGSAISDGRQATEGKSRSWSRRGDGPVQVAAAASHSLLLVCFCAASILAHASDTSTALSSQGGAAIMILEHSVEAGERRVARREIGRIPGAVRIAVPELGTQVAVLTSQGRVWTWDRLRPDEGWRRVDAIEGVVALAAGAQHLAALRGDGKVWTWGENAQGQLGDGTLLPNHEPRHVAGLDGVVSVAAGALFTAALKADGSLWVFGSTWGEIAPGIPEKMLARPVQVQGRTLYGEITVEAGQVVERQPGLRLDWLDQIHSAAAAAPLGRVVDVAEGWTLGWIEESPAIALAATQVNNGFARQAAGRLPHEVAPIRVGSTMDVAGALMVATSKQSGGHTLALASDGTVWAWGENASGQLGDGTYLQRSAPVRVSVLTGVIWITAGHGFSLAVGTTAVFGHGGQTRMDNSGSRCHTNSGRHKCRVCPEW